MSTTDYEEESTASLTLLASLLRRDLKVSNKKQNPKTALADEIYNLWGITFPHAMKLITDKGIQCVREVFEEVKKASCKNPPALFLWKLKQIKVELRTVQVDALPAKQG